MFFERVEADDAVRGEVEEDESVGEVAAGGFEHGGVFGGVERDAGAGREGACPVGEYGVGAFGGAGVKDEAGGWAAEEFGEAFAGGVEAEAGAGAVAGGAGGIMPGFVGQAQPGFARDRREGGGGVVVEVRHRERRDGAREVRQ